ncbi:phage portal protein [Helcococcus bovis]|uniref:phage portal protein n=1 Tax=Helcococcus bovis TaxID=3153252 RepID=UPI0038BE1493
MALIRSVDSLFNGEGLIFEEVEKLIKEHEQGLDRLKNLEDYYNGNHKILERDRGKNVANNKVLINHAEYITDFATSYFIGNPISYQFDGQGANDKTEESLLEAFDFTDIDMVDSDLARDLSIYGLALEYIYQDKEGNTKSVAVNPKKAFLVVDDTIEYNSLLGVYYYDLKEKGKIVGSKVHAYTKDLEYILELRNGKISQKEEPKELLFGKVPLIEYWNKPNQKGDFENVISLIDAYNVLQSDRINDKQQFVDAILVLYGTVAGDNNTEKSETAKAIKELGMLEMPTGTGAEFIVKSFNETDVDMLRKSIINDIHKISKVPNLTDEHFAGNSSGVAMKYKLLGLEQLAQGKENYFKMGIRKRIELYSTILNIKGLYIDPRAVKPVFTRSLPANEIEISQLINNLKGTVSDETLLLQLPFVNDVQDELDKIRGQRENNIELNQNLFGGYDSKDTGIENEED